MKKLLLSLTMMLAMFAASAQNIIVTEVESGNVVENGANYLVYDYNPDMMEIAMEFNVTNTTGDVLNVVCEKVENNVVEGTLNYLCFGQCLSPEVYSIEVSLNPGEPTLFSVHYMPMEMFGEQSMTYFLYESNNPDAKFVINIVFKYSLENVEEVTVANVISAYPTPATDIINFDYSVSGNAMVVIYNMMGQEMMRSDLNGNSGKLSMNVSDLNDGIYFYSLVVNGRTEKSSKLVIR